MRTASRSCSARRKTYVEPSQSSSWAVQDPTRASSAGSIRSRLIIWIRESYWTGTYWTHTTVGGSVADGTTPAVVYNPRTGLRAIYYVNRSDNEIISMNYVLRRLERLLPREHQGRGPAQPQRSRSNPDTGATAIYYVN